MNREGAKDREGDEWEIISPPPVFASFAPSRFKRLVER